jgi:hypothetical protein
MKDTQTNPFYIVAREPGSLSHNLPLWGSREDNPLNLSSHTTLSPEHQPIKGVPGAFQILNVLSEEECLVFIHAAETMGYTEDAAVSLGRNVRHNMNLNWIVDSYTEKVLWSRIANFFELDKYGNRAKFLHKNALGLNQRFRFYRYKVADFFGIHTDGAWPGSQIINGSAVADAFGDRHSLYTCLVFLSDDFVDGATQFLVDINDQTKPARTPNNATTKAVRTPVGGMLLFPHGTHPLHCLHSSQKIAEGVKYIIRTDVLFNR